MNKKSIITLLVALVSITGQGQVHFRIEGNIGMPDFTGVMEIKDVLKQQSVPKRLCKQTPFHKRRAN